MKKNSRFELNGDDDVDSFLSMKRKESFLEMSSESEIQFSCPSI